MSSETEVTGIVSLTEPVPATYLNLLVPKKFGKKGKESGEPKYSANLQFEIESTDLKTLKATAANVAKARWPGRSLKELSFPFSDGTKSADKAKAEKKNREFYRGKVILAARSKFEPRLSGIENGNVVDYEDEARKLAIKKFYPGVLVLAQIHFKAYDGVGNNPDGVTAYLNMVFTTNRGTRINAGSGPTSAEVFKDYVGQITTEDPTAGVDDDEIPF